MPLFRQGILVGVYVAVATCGMAWLWGNDRSGGATGAVGISPARFDVGGVGLKSDGVRVVVVIHPKCPCSLATLDVVDEIWRRRDRAGGAELLVLLVRPEGAAEGFEEGRAAERAREMMGRAGGGRVEVDVGGEKARRLGATISGHVAVYGAEGELLASGGVTRSRGHSDRSAVAVAMETALVAGSDGAVGGKNAGGGVTTAAVFGCALGVGSERAVRTVAKEDLESRSGIGLVRSK